MPAGLPEDWDAGFWDEMRLAREFDERADRLMEAYQRRYDPDRRPDLTDEAEVPVYRTAAEAISAAAGFRDLEREARAECGRLAGEAERLASQVRHLRGARLPWPWQRRRAETGKHADDLDFERYLRLRLLDDSIADEIAQGGLAAHAEAAFDSLTRFEAARAAADRAAARAMGWEPGEPPIDGGRAVFRAGGDGIEAVPGDGAIQAAAAPGRDGTAHDQATARADVQGAAAARCGTSAASQAVGAAGVPCPDTSLIMPPPSLPGGTGPVQRT